jgi:hypothetical protein
MYIWWYAVPGDDGTCMREEGKTNYGLKENSYLIQGRWFLIEF